MWITVLRFLAIVTLILVAAQLGMQLLSLISRVFGQRRMDRLRVEQLRLEIAKLRTSLQDLKESGQAWEGWRKFRVQRKVAECRDCHSLYLVPHDGKPLPRFLPGQFLTFQLRVPREDKPLVRCYSLSSAPDPEYFRCTIQKLDAPDGGVAPGKASTYLNDEIGEGDLIDVKAPRGSFHLDESDPRPVALLAAGIGITPLLSMLRALVARPSSQDIHLFYGVRNSRKHVFKHQLEEIARDHPHVRIVTCYSQPLETDVAGRDYDVQGHITVELLEERLPTHNFGFYVCGPSEFMQTMVEGLIGWGVARTSIHSEAFGPSSLKRRAADVVEPAGDSVTAPTNPMQIDVCFDRSKKACQWETATGTLLDLAEATGVPIDVGCRSGNCGTCVTAVKSGSVDYTEAPEVDVDEGTCLPCVAVPKGPVVLDA